MTIKFELKKNLEDKTRRLGTRADSYLDEFFDIYYELPEIKTLNEFFNESERMQKSSESTKKQVEEVLLIFRIVNIEGKIIIPKLSDKEMYVQILTSNIKTTIKRRVDLQSNHKNTHKLLNSFIYAHGTTFFSEQKIKVSEFTDDSMMKRTVEMKSGNNIAIDSELKSIVKKELNIILESCGYSLKQKEELKEYVENTISKKEYDIDEIDNYKKTMDSKVKNIFNLIDDVLEETKIITIPFYQREYVWTPELIENFIKEISSDRNEILNIGNILICIKNNESNHVQEYALVDGQQRLTSIIMIVNYLSKSLKSVDLRNLPSELKLKQEQCSDSKMINFIENKSNPEYMRELKVLLDLPVNEKKISKKNDPCLKINYDIIASFINGLTDDSKRNLFIKLAYIFSTVTFDSSSDEIELFISTNSSRKPLSYYDLIRSFIISKIPEKISAIILKNINDKMNELTTLLKFNGEGSETAEDTFFTFYLNYIDRIDFDDTSKDKDIFKRFRNVFNVRLSTSNDVILLLENIISVLESYRVIKGIDEIEHIYLKDFLLSLGNGLKVTSIYDVFFVYFVEKLKNEEVIKERVKLLNEFRKILLVIEQFEIKWKLFVFGGDSLSGALSNLFSDFYEAVNDHIDEKEYDGLSDSFKEIISTGEGFISRVINEEKYNDPNEYVDSDNIKKQKNALKILNRVAFNLFNNGIEYKSNSTQYFFHSKPTIEHIFPRTNSKWASDDKTNALELEVYLEDIGNKFIFNKDENSSAGNKTFSEKIKIYKEYNNLKLDKTLFFKYYDIEFDILKKNSWTPKDVKNRSFYIIEELLKIWN